VYLHVAARVRLDDVPGVDDRRVRIAGVLLREFDSVDCCDCHFVSPPDAASICLFVVAVLCADRRFKWVHAGCPRGATARMAASSLSIVSCLPMNPAAPAVLARRLVWASSLRLRMITALSGAVPFSRAVAAIPSSSGIVTSIR